MQVSLLRTIFAHESSDDRVTLRMSAFTTLYEVLSRLGAAEGLPEGFEADHHQLSITDTRSLCSALKGVQ